MSAWTEADRRMGIWSSTSVATIGVAYVTVGMIGVAARTPRLVVPRLGDPHLGILEVLIILSAVALVAVIAVVHAYARPESKTIAGMAFACITCFAVLTCAVHFASLTVGRQIDPRAFPLLAHQLFSFEWPTLATSLDLLAWDFFLGLALLFAAQVFTEKPAFRVRISMTVAGALCLLATLGPTSGHLSIQYLGVAGYAFALPITCALLAIFFWQARLYVSGRSPL